MSEMLTQAEIKERIRVVEIEARWQRGLRDHAKRDMNRIRRDHPADALSFLAMQREAEFRDRLAKQFAAEARSYKRRLV